MEHSVAVEWLHLHNYGNSTDLELLSVGAKKKAVHALEPQYYAPTFASQFQALSIAHPYVAASEGVRPVKISVVASADDTAEQVRNGAVDLMRMADDPLLHCIKQQQFKQHRRGLDPATTANVPADDRGIDP